MVSFSSYLRKDRILWSLLMLAHHRKPVCFSFISIDLPIWSTLETSATLYQKDKNQFHVLLSELSLPQSLEERQENIWGTDRPNNANQGLLWLEISPSRVIMTMQGNSKLNYRHFWERGVYGVSRYWLNGSQPGIQSSLRLRNFTRNLKVEGHPLPKSLRIEYELWSSQLQLGQYVLHLEIQH